MPKQLTSQDLQEDCFCAIVDWIGIDELRLARLAARPDGAKQIAEEVRRVVMVRTGDKRAAA